MSLSLSPSSDTGSLGIIHLKRYWEKSMAKRAGLLAQDAFHEEWNADTTLLWALNLGLEQTITYLYQQAPAFEAFEAWILAINGGQLPQAGIESFNRVLNKKNERADGSPGSVLSAEDLACWRQNGYVIVREAVSKEDCATTVDAIYEFLGMSPHDPASWYQPHPARQGIMVQLFQHPALDSNRTAPKIRGAYQQLWGKTDLWMNTDRVSFNPPENEQWHFPGPRLHWDVSLELPIPYGLQGLLYLSDTLATQGAFTLVPGFHHKIEEWIGSLPAGAGPRTQDLYALGATPIAANAGDFIIWHQALPHGSSPNTATAPRIVQYINYLPVDGEIKEVWK